VYALVALGLNLQYGLMRILNIAHGEFLMVGAFITWWAQSALGVSPLLMVPVSFALLMAAGLLIHRLTFRRLTRTSPNLDIFEARGLMVSFGLMFLVQNFAQALWGGDLRGYDFMADPVEIPGPGGGAQFAANKLLLLALALAFSAALITVLRKTLYGKGVRALMQSPTGAQLVGIDTGRLHPLMFGVGLGLSGVAGCLLSMTYTISPSMGEPYTVTALIVITLGGFGSMTGALVGGLALGVIEAFGMHFTSPSLKSLLSYGIFIAVLLWRPNGLFTRK
jgi:branched-chain amino acid transport system permease protein